MRRAQNILYGVERALRRYKIVCVLFVKGRFDVGEKDLEADAEVLPLK
jgi:hypothetical protein